YHGGGSIRWRTKPESVAITWSAWRGSSRNWISARWPRCEFIMVAFGITSRSQFVNRGNDRESMPFTLDPRPGMGCLLQYRAGSIWSHVQIPELSERGKG